MRNEDLKKIIEILNCNSESNLIQKKKLSENVEFAKIWDETPKETDNISNKTFYEYFLIKNESQEYVAIILDMFKDLHWFVDEKHRKKGYLTKNLREIIIPYLMASREIQRITIDKSKIGEENYTASKKVALNLGFVQKTETEFLLENNEEFFKKYLRIVNSEINYGIDRNRIEELKRKINFTANYLLLIQNEIELKIGDLDYAEDLKELVELIKSHTWKLEDIWHSKNN